MEDNKLIQHHIEVFDKCVNISRAKCKDYADDQDPLRNFRACENFGVPIEKGIMVRLSDKISRIGNLLDKENDVKDESIEDTIFDACNYLSILLFSLREKNGNITSRPRSGTGFSRKHTDEQGCNRGNDNPAG